MALLVKRPIQHNMAQPAVATVCAHRELYTASAVFLVVGSALLKDQMHLSCCLSIAENMMCIAHTPEHCIFTKSDSKQHAQVTTSGIFAYVAQ